jgi:membrane protease YdiL (CAAX protease family)
MLSPEGPSGVKIATSPRITVPALCGLLFVLIVPQLPVGHWIAPGATMPAMLVREAVWWLYAVAVILWLLDEEGLPVSSIGLRRPTWKTLWLALFAFVLLLAVFVIQQAVIIPMFHLDGSMANAQRAAMLKTPYWYRVLLVLRAAVVEEILFRGYLIEKVRQVTGSWLLAVLVSVLAFTCAHLSSWGAVHLIAVGGAAVILAVFYVWKRDLPANMIAHFLIDGTGFLLS